MAPRARKPPKPKSTPTRKQANAFDKAHQALRDSYDIEKPQGWKDILSSLDDGKQLLDKILVRVARLGGDKSVFPLLVYLLTAPCRWHGTSRTTMPASTRSG